MRVINWEARLLQVPTVVLILLTGSWSQIKSYRPCKTLCKGVNIANPSFLARRRVDKAVVLRFVRLLELSKLSFALKELV